MEMGSSCAAGRSRSQSSWKASTRLPGPHAERAWSFQLHNESRCGEEHRRAVSEHCSEVLELRQK